MKFKVLRTRIASAAAILLFSVSMSAASILLTVPTTGPTGNMQQVDDIYWAQPNLLLILLGTS
jgi:hypothetical protein